MAKVVILSGAGISAESGISTFRDSDGLWEEYDIKDICTAGCLVTNRDETIDFYDKRRLDLRGKESNYAHRVIAGLKKEYPDDISVITQNIDNLFERAGLDADEVIHLHGFLPKMECESCGEVYEIGLEKLEDYNDGKCPSCGSDSIRPFIVMFGEAAPKYEDLSREISNCELLVIIGTSGNVINTDALVGHVDRSILNNLERSNAIYDELYSKVLYKKATLAIDEIAGEIEDFLN